MAWERRGDRRYYYRKVWTNGTCKSQYLGDGFTAFAEDIGLADERRRRAVERAERRAEAEADRQVDDILATTRTLRNIVLYASGYHRHKGQWRKKRKKPAR